MKKIKWTLQGYDTFAHEGYRIAGEFDTETAAIAAAKTHLAELEVEQPEASSGGPDGIQDHIYVIRPDGTRFRCAK